MEKLDWTKPTGKALVYFLIRNVPIDSIIEEVYTEVIEMPESQRRDLMGIVQTKLISKLRERANNDLSDYDSEEGFVIARACSFYCYDKLYEGKTHSNFYDFLAEYKHQLQS